MGGAVIAVICFLGAVFWGLYAGRTRRDALSHPALALGLQYRRERNYRLAERAPFLDRMRLGANRYTCNQLTGIYRGHAIEAFDYCYETEAAGAGGKPATRRRSLSFFILQLPGRFPELTITRDDTFSVLAAAGDRGALNTERPALSETYKVFAKDMEFARCCCTALKEYLQKHPDLNIVLDQNQLAAGYASPLSEDEIRPRLDQLIELRGLLPESPLDV